MTDEIDKKYDEQEKKVNIQSKVNTSTFHLFVFPGTQSDTKVQTISNVANLFSGIINIEVIPLTPQTRSLYHAFGIQNSGYYLIRPDMFIAYRSNSFDEAHFEKYLMRFLTKSKVAG